ncbi:hypothetical protein F4859DRAFT_431314 [Xylaria cf. heliscus]|nr:hypothetical protein F4859DRAFT_431314 [Xylaria cf. heliscus]
MHAPTAFATIMTNHFLPPLMIVTFCLGTVLLPDANTKCAAMWRGCCCAPAGMSHFRPSGLRRNTLRDRLTYQINGH